VGQDLVLSSIVQETTNALVKEGHPRCEYVSSTKRPSSDPGWASIK